MMRPAPFCFADKTPSRPTAPSPTTTTVPPGFTLAASAANQPVPMTSDSVSRLGSSSSEGTSGVATSVPSASGTRSRGACAVVGPQIGPAHTSYRYPHDGICRFYDFRLRSLLEAHVAGCIENCTFHCLVLHFIYFDCPFTSRIRASCNVKLVPLVLD